MSLNKRWHCHYSVSKNGIRAKSVTEPREISIGYGKYSTKEEAIKAFSIGLDHHVHILIRQIKFHGLNGALRKRLIKYGNTEALKALDETERLLKALPDFDYEKE